MWPVDNKNANYGDQCLNRNQRKECRCDGFVYPPLLPVNDQVDVNAATALR